MLTQALIKKEHPGQTRGAGYIPWNIAFEADSSSYRSRSRRAAKRQEEEERQLKAMEERITATVETRVESEVQARVGAYLQNIARHNSGLLHHA